jgi:hypothetical protein
MIHCLKTNLHAHTDEITVGGRRWHASSYPVAEVLRLFRRYGFDALGITEHDRETSAVAVVEACRLDAGATPPLTLLAGHEEVVEVQTGGGLRKFHVLQILDEGRPALRILCHPVRTWPDSDLVELAAFFAARHGVGAVELDMLVARNPARLARYDDLSRRTGLPVVSNSDFHGELLDLPNHFTVFLCDEPTTAGVVRAILTGAYVAFHPDRATWTLRPRPGASRLAAEWVRDAEPGRFTRRFGEFSTIDPPVRRETMTADDIGRFHRSAPIVLRRGGMAAAILPERGARLAGLWADGAPVADPVINACCDTEDRAEVYEATFAAYEVIEAATDRAVFERRLTDHQGHAGLTVRKTYEMEYGALRVVSRRVNLSAAPVEIHENFRSRFLKPYGGEVLVRVESPVAAEYRVPVNAFLPCDGGARLSVTCGGYELGLECRDATLATLSLWARADDGWALVMFDYAPRTLQPGEEAAEHVVTLRPRAT